MNTTPVVQTVEEIDARVLKGKRVLITGTTGFVGKVVLEKLIRDVPEIGEIVLVIRANRKHGDARQRFYQEIATSSIFNRLRSADEAAFLQFCETRIQFITGEITEAKLGLTDGAFNTLGRSLDLIINSAASVNFREALDQAISINTNSLNEIIALSRLAGDCPVVQVSTCYVHGFHSGLINESNHRPAGQWIPRAPQGYFEVESVLADLQAKIAAVKLEQRDPILLEEALIELGVRESHRYGWNDTYTFTKWMGEQVLLKAMQGKALTILRPSIVESTLSEPAAGWLEGVKVADAVILAYAREKVTLFPGKPGAVIDIIPVDLVANAILLAGMEALALKPGHRIYQVCSSSSNPLKIHQVIDYVQEEAHENYHLYDRLFYRKPQRRFVMIPRLAFHLTMVSGFYLAKAGSKIAGLLAGKSGHSKALDNLETTLKLSLVFSFYTSPNYIFSNERLLELSRRASPEALSRFPVRADSYDWRHYLRKIHVPGLNQYALKPRRKRSESSAEEGDERVVSGEPEKTAHGPV
ncbi:MAG: SDR family oxidoreductase [Hahellaceae bacterium]|nr:SDR family oxidoreductase [Hahellaceae bacterium]